MTELEQRRFAAAYGPQIEPLRRLGQGAMGEVWQVRVGGVERALKVVSEELLSRSGAESLERFRREGDMLAGLPPHPGVVKIHAILPGPPPGILLDLVEGESLADRVRRRPLEFAELRTLVTAIAAALGHCHRHGIVHRDLKLANVMIGKQGPVLVDFGVARSASVETLTRTGAMVGTPEAMAPEQIEGRRVDARADVWAFGVLLHELLTGQKPFVADGVMALAHAILHRTAPTVRSRAPEAPEDLAALADQCLSKDPEERPADGDALLLALERQENDRPRPWPARKVGLVLAALALVTLIPLLVTRVRLRAAREARRREALELIGKSLGQVRRARERILADLLIEPWVASAGQQARSVRSRVADELSPEGLERLASVKLGVARERLEAHPVSAALLALSTGNSEFASTPRIERLIERLRAALEERHESSLEGAEAGEPRDPSEEVRELDQLLRARALIGKSLSKELTPGQAMQLASRRAAAISALPTAWRDGLARIDRELNELWSLTSTTDASERRDVDGVLLSEPAYDRLHRRLILARLRQAGTADARCLALLRWWARITPGARERLAPASFLKSDAGHGLDRRVVAELFVELARPVMILQKPPYPLGRMETGELTIQLAFAAKQVLPDCRPFDKLSAVERGEMYVRLKRPDSGSRKRGQRILRLAEKFIQLDVKPPSWVLEIDDGGQSLAQDARPSLFYLGVELTRLDRRDEHTVDSKKDQPNWTERDKSILRQALGRLMMPEESDTCVATFSTLCLGLAQKLMPGELDSLDSEWVELAQRVARSRISAPYVGVYVLLNNMLLCDTSCETRVEVAAIVVRVARRFSGRDLPVWCGEARSSLLELSRGAAFKTIVDELVAAPADRLVAVLPHLSDLAEPDRVALLAALRSRRDSKPAGDGAKATGEALEKLWARSSDPGD